MEREKQFIMLVGNIGSGKSTLSKQYFEQGYCILSRDALRYMVGSGEYLFDYEVEKAIAFGYLTLMREFMKEGWNIVSDETNVSKKLRDKQLAIAREYGYSCCADILPRLTQMESVSRRMSNPHGQDDESLWNSVWEMFEGMYEEPTLDEGFGVIIHR